jgi:hypothetical protein
VREKGGGGSLTFPDGPGRLSRQRPAPPVGRKTGTGMHRLGLPAGAGIGGSARAPYGVAVRRFDPAPGPAPSRRSAPPPTALSAASARRGLAAEKGSRRFGAADEAGRGPGGSAVRRARQRGVEREPPRTSTRSSPADPPAVGPPGVHHFPPPPPTPPPRPPRPW